MTPVAGVFPTCNRSLLNSNFQGGCAVLPTLPPQPPYARPLLPRSRPGSRVHIQRRRGGLHPTPESPLRIGSAGLAAGRAPHSCLWPPLQRPPLRPHPAPRGAARKAFQLTKFIFFLFFFFFFTLLYFTLLQILLPHERVEGPDHTGGEALPGTYDGPEATRVFPHFNSILTSALPSRNSSFMI